MSLERLMDVLKPRSVEEQLAPALNSREIMRALSIPLLVNPLDVYRDRPSKALYALKRYGFVIRPEPEGSHEEQCRTLVEKINALEQHQVLIIPYDANIFPKVEHRGKLAKKHNLLRIPRFYNLKSPESVDVLVREALETEKMSDVYFGIDFKGVQETDRQYKVFTLFDCVRAFIADKEIRFDAIDTRPYIDTDRIFERGGKAVVVVPSFSGGQNKEVVLQHIPIYAGNKSEQQIRTSFDFFATDTCKRSDFFIVSYGRTTFPLFSGEERIGDEVLLDHHVILAFRRAARRISSKITDRGHLEVMDIFPRPNKETEAFFFKLNRQTIFEAADNGKIRRFPLGSIHPYMEVILHKRVAYNNKKRISYSELSSSEL